MLHQNNFYCHINEKNQVNRPPLFNDFYELKLNNRAKLKNEKKKGYILSRDSEVTLSHWSRSIELVIMPLIDL
jgi:hypothetical protein